MVLKAFLYSVIIAIFTATCFAWWATTDFLASGPLKQPTTLVFPSGDRFTRIADALYENNVITHPLLFEALVFVRGESARFKAGEYAFPAHMSALDVAVMIAGGKTIMHHLTIPEGLMTSEILALVKQAPALDGEITLDPGEGELMPETYNYSRGDKRNEMITRMRHTMQKTLAEIWAGRADGLPIVSAEQALILASIVEKETGLPGERPHVASVYINRLRKGMLLQADPTTAYAVTQGKYKLLRPLSLADLQIDSPYNTYRAPGLPPGPIANPGRASLLAAVHPLATDDLYFVATGVGGSYFARTVQEHEENVKKYRALGH